LRKLARRHRTGLTIAALFAVLLVAGAAVSIWQAVRANAERDRALKAEGNAQNSATEAQAVLAFFQDKVLSAGRPEGEEGGLGKDVTLRQALDAAEPKIAAAFADQPLIEASIRNALGITYRCLGETGSALKQHERALELHKTVLGTEDPRTLVSMNNLALAYSEDGRFKEALPLFEHVLKVRQAKLGPEHPLTLRSMHSLGVAYCDQNRDAEAIPFFDEAYKKQKATLGPKHLDTLDSMHSLAIAYKAVGRIDDALALYKETLKLHEETLGADNPATLLVLNNLAGAYGEAGLLSEALPLFERVLKLRTAKLGSDHPQTLRSLYNLAMADYLLGRLSDALPRYEQTLKLRKVKLTADHPEIFATTIQLALVYQELGQYDRVEKLLAGVPDRIKKKLGENDPLLPLALACLGRNHLLQNQDEAAVKLLRQSLDLYALHPEESQIDMIFDRGLLGIALLHQKKYAEAEPLLRQGSEGFLADAAKRPQCYAPGTPGRRHLSDALDHLVKLYGATGKSDDAERWRKELAAWAK